MTTADCIAEIMARHQKSIQHKVTGRVIAYSNFDLLTLCGPWKRTSKRHDPATRNLIREFKAEDRINGTHVLAFATVTTDPTDTTFISIVVV